MIKMRSGNKTTKLQKITIFTKDKKFHIIILIAVCFLAYLNIFQNEFAFDDSTFLDWDKIKTWDNIIPFFRGDVPPGHGGIYRPLRSIFYTISHQLWGSNPWGYHIQSIIIITTLTLLIYFITELITKRKSIAFMTAIIFGLHPIHTESITFITASFDSIGIIFFFLSFYLYLKAKNITSNKILCYSISLATAAIAFFTYEMTLTLPFLIILYEICFSNRSLNKFKLYLPYFSIGVIYTSIRVFVFHIITRGEYVAGSFYITILTMVKVVLKYLTLIILPINLNVNHQISKGIVALIWAESDKKVLLTQSILQIDILIPVILIISLMLIAVQVFRKHPIITFSILWYFISLSPVLNIIPQAALMAERYEFISSFGYCLLIAYIFKYTFNRNLNWINVKYWKPTLVFTFVLVISFYFVSTIWRNSQWKNSETLWYNAVKVAPDSFLNNFNLAANYGVEQKYDLAIKQYLKLKTLVPSDHRVYTLLAETYEKQDRLDSAIEEYTQVIKIKPDIPLPYNALGTIYEKQNKFDQAIASYNKAIDIDKKDSSIPRFNLGTIYEKQNKFDQAIDEYKKAIGIDKNYIDAHYNLGIIFYNQQKTNQAIEEFKKTIAINPKFAEAYFSLGKIYQQNSKILLAIDEYKKAIEIKIDYKEAHNNLGIIYAQYGSISLAIEEFLHAIKIDNNYAEAHYNLGKSYSQEQKIDLAIKEFAKYLTIDPTNDQVIKVLEDLKSLEKRITI